MARRTVLAGAALALLPPTPHGMAPARCHQGNTFDPMRDLLIRYNDAMAAYEADGDKTDEESQAIEESTWGPLWEELVHRTPKTFTHGGAVAALCYVVAEGSISREDRSVLLSVLTFLEGQAA